MIFFSFRHSPCKPSLHFTGLLLLILLFSSHKCYTFKWASEQGNVSRKRQPSFLSGWPVPLLGTARPSSTKWEGGVTPQPTTGQRLGWWWWRWTLSLSISCGGGYGKVAPLLGNHPRLFRTEVDAEGVWLHKALPITIAMVLDVARAFTILHHIHLTTACLCGHLPIS